jgi:hypothetical protein
VWLSNARSHSFRVELGFLRLYLYYEGKAYARAHDALFEPCKGSIGTDVTHKVHVISRFGANSLLCKA